MSFNYLATFDKGFVKIFQPAEGEKILKDMRVRHILCYNTFSLYTVLARK